MKYTLVTVVGEETVKEEVIEIMPGDKLIVTYDTSINLSMEYIHSMSKYIAEVLKSDSKIISIPDFVSIKVLRINEQ